MILIVGDTEPLIPYYRRRDASKKDFDSTMDMDKDDIEREWQKHTYDGFPRDLALIPDLTNRRPCRNFENFKYFMWRGWGVQDCYVAVYPDSSGVKDYEKDSTVTANKIYFDVDAEGDLNLAYDNMRALVRYAKEHYGYDARVYFSGKKGFAVYYDFKPVVLSRYCDTLHLWTDELAEKLHMIRPRDLDPTAIGEKRRISRVPFTPHMRSGKLCQPISPSWSLKSILGGKGTLVEINQCSGIGEELLFIDEQLLSGTKQTTGGITWEHGGFKPLDKTDQYLKELNFVFEAAPRYAAGRHRTLWQVIIPRLIYLLGNGEFQKLSEEEQLSITDRIFGLCYEWALRTPKNDPNGEPRKTDVNYANYIKATLRQAKRSKYKAWELETFFLSNPELARFWEGYEP